MSARLCVWQENLHYSCMEILHLGISLKDEQSNAHDSVYMKLFCCMRQIQTVLLHKIISHFVKKMESAVKKWKDFLDVILLFVSYFVFNLFYLTYLLTLIWFCPFYHLPHPPSPSFPSIFLLSTYPILKSHPRLGGMSHHSSVASGAALVILRGHVHLSKQWIKKHSEARRAMNERMENIYLGGAYLEPFQRSQVKDHLPRVTG